MCVRITAHNRCIKHRTVLIIFPVILQTIIIAQMMSTGGEGGKKLWKLARCDSLCCQLQPQNAVLLSFSGSSPTIGGGHRKITAFQLH